MKNIKSLPVLTALVDFAKSSKHSANVENIVFVCVQHLLTTTSSLFDAILEIGALPQNIFVLGKSYSTSPIVLNELISLGIQVQKSTPLEKLGNYRPSFICDIKNMWENVTAHIKGLDTVEAIFVLDEGGHCLEAIPLEILGRFTICGIEQTSSGFFNPNVLSLKIPIIDVARSAAKTLLEPTIITNEITEELEFYLKNRKRNILCGVVGVGMIGSAVAKKLLSLGFNVKTYDIKQNKNIDTIPSSDSFDALLSEADYIFGCTGHDITKDLNPHDIQKNKVFISCSSEDIEFLSLLNFIQNSDNTNEIFKPLEDIEYTIKAEVNIKILKGGFPFNFNNHKEIATPNDIQLTRGLLFCALLQCISELNDLKEYSGRIILDPFLQKLVVGILSKQQSNLPTEIMGYFNDIVWIIFHSHGTPSPSSLLKLKEKCRNDPLSLV